MIIEESVMQTMLSNCINWFEMQEKADATQVLFLHRIRNLAAMKAQTKHA